MTYPALGSAYECRRHSLTHTVKQNKVKQNRKTGDGLEKARGMWGSFQELNTCLRRHII